MHFCGDDHLDADRVVLKAKTEKKQKKAEADGPKKNGGAAKKQRGAKKGNGEKGSKARKRHSAQQQEKLLSRIETAETRMQEIDAAFCAPGFYTDTPDGEVKQLQIERSELEREVEDLTGEWERAEA